MSQPLTARLLLPALLLAVGHPLVAQSQPELPSAVNPALVVPPVEYRSVFSEVSRGVEAGSVDWKQANDQVGQFRRGHIDILKWEQQQDAATPPGNVRRNMPGHHGHGVAP